MNCQYHHTPSCENKNCNAAIEARCGSFKPYPPAMTAEKFTEKQVESLSEVPAQFWSALSNIAWEQGHSAGYEETLGILRVLISALRPSIQQFEKDIRDSAKEN